MRWLWRVMTRNLLLKSTALVCAVVLWVYVDGFVLTRRVVRLTVGDIEDMAPSLTIRDGDGLPASVDAADTIRITIVGPSRFVRLFGARNVHYVGPPADVARQRNQLAGGGEMVPVPTEDFAVVGAPGVTILSVEPEEIVLRPSPGEQQ